MSKFPENSIYRVSADFSKRMKQLIEDNFCDSNQDFAKLVEVSTPVISKATNFGIYPSTKVLVKIADKLELSFKYLLGMDDKNNFIPSANPTTFYARLDELSKEKDWKYSTLASKTSFSRTYIYEWIKEKTLPSIDYLFELADLFEVSPDYLLGRSDYKN